MTWHDLVREYLPDMDDRECCDILWGETCFPFGSIDQVRMHVAQLACTMNFWCGGPFPSADEEMERGMSELRARDAAELGGR